MGAHHSSSRRVRIAQLGALDYAICTRNGFLPASCERTIHIMVRVIVADPQPFFRQAFMTALAHETGFEPLDDSGDEIETAATAVEGAVDLILTEIELAGGSGLHLPARIGASVPVIVVTRHHEADVLMDVAVSGAVGCISHAVGLKRVVELLRGFRPGRFCVDDERLLEILRQAGRAPVQESDNLRRLTVREREVLVRLSSGATDDAIAESLYISRHTVRTHVGNILRKLGVHSRAQAARLALAADPDRRSQPDVLRIDGPGWGSD